jgi:hypothetical protein
MEVQLTFLNVEKIQFLRLKRTVWETAVVMGEAVILTKII